MDLRQLEALVAVADHGGFSAAADALDTVQSNVSAHVAKLERELGVVLVDRGAARLTEEGEVVVARARRISGEVEAITADISALGNEVVGKVRFGIIGTTARWLLPRVLSLAGARHPQLHLVAVEGTSASLALQLTGGRLDLALLNLPAPSRDLVFTELFEEDLVLLTAPDGPLGDRSEIEPQDLDAVELLLPMEGTVFRDELAAAMAPAGVTLRARAEMDGAGLIASLAFDGMGPAILPATAVPTELRPSWRLIPIRGVPRRRVGVAMRARARPSPSARALLELVTEVAEDQRSRPEGLYPAGTRA